MSNPRRNRKKLVLSFRNISDNLYEQRLANVSPEKNPDIGGLFFYMHHPARIVDAGQSVKIHSQSAFFRAVSANPLFDRQSKPCIASVVLHR